MAKTWYDDDYLKLEVEGMFAKLQGFRKRPDHFLDAPPAGRHKTHRDLGDGGWQAKRQRTDY